MRQIPWRPGFLSSSLISLRASSHVNLPRSRVVCLSYARRRFAHTSSDEPNVENSKPNWNWQTRYRDLPPERQRTVRIVGWCMLASLVIHIPLISGAWWYASIAAEDLSPFDHHPMPVEEIDQLTPRHKNIRVPLSDKSRHMFGDLSVGMDGNSLDVEGGAVAVQHVGIKTRTMEVEKLYTPVNDPAADGYMDIVVKKVRGGEIGRMIFALQYGDKTDFRGNMTTFAVNPYDWDRIVMISTGTGIAPFLQLLSKLPSTTSSPPSSVEPTTSSDPSASSSSSSSTFPSSSSPPSSYESIRIPPGKRMPELHLIHTLPPPDPADTDWPVTAGFLPSLQEKLGGDLVIHRVPQGEISLESVEEALGRRKGRRWSWSSSIPPNNERVMVIVALPPKYMRPLCGPMTADWQQGELTGVLRDAGLRPEQVWKLEG